MIGMKYAGIAILAVGVAIAALYGSRLTPSVEEKLELEGAAKFLGASEQQAFEAYCAARAEADLEPADGCPDPDGEEQEPEPAAEEDEDAPTPSYEEMVESARAQLESMRNTEEVLTGEVLDLREAWIAAREANIEPAAAVATAETPGPGMRLSTWAAQSGPMFGLGLLLIVVGAVMGRVAVRREASEDPTAAPRAQPAKDFGETLDGLTRTIRALADEVSAIDAPEPADYLRVKSEIHDAQLEAFEPLVDARARVQFKYGMAGFADIFGPLSSAERKVNRAWSAVVDGHWPETQDSLKAAATDLEETHQVLTRLTPK